MSAIEKINELLSLGVESLSAMGYQGIRDAVAGLRAFSLGELRQAIRDDERLVYVGEYCKSKAACIRYIEKRLSERLQSYQRCSF